MGGHNSLLGSLFGFGAGDAVNHPQDALIGRTGSTSDKRILDGALQLPPQVYQYGSDVLAAITGNPLIAGAGQYMAKAAHGGLPELAANLFPLDAKGIMGKPKALAVPAQAGTAPAATGGVTAAGAPGGLPISGSTAPNIYPWAGHSPTGGGSSGGSNAGYGQSEGSPQGGLPAIPMGVTDLKDVVNG